MKYHIQQVIHSFIVKLIHPKQFKYQHHSKKHEKSKIQKYVIIND
jgi:hypothetical protein